MIHNSGNGWAAAGMLRVLGTIQHSQFSNSMKNQAKDLTNWVNEIHNGVYSHIVSPSAHRLRARVSFSAADA